MSYLYRIVAALLLLASACADAEIVIGQTSGFTGLAAPGVMENTEGAKLWFDHVNSHGGVHGQKIRLVSLDDGFVPQEDRSFKGPFPLATGSTGASVEALIAVFVVDGNPPSADDRGRTRTSGGRITGLPQRFDHFASVLRSPGAADTRGPGRRVA